ncbi:MAG: vanadium-dependent haloperoxidase [Tatlockia sp.]|nr:vanadium-dependent haloperoxidase [Tatlockia sp.]
MKKVGITAVLLVGILVIGIFYSHSKKANLPTYFNYNPKKLNLLNKSYSKLVITAADLHKWDEVMFALVKSNKFGDAPASRIYAYVYTAQRDAAFLSYNMKHDFMGSLDPVSAAVLCQFFPNDCSKIKLQSKVDLYSEQLAALVLVQIKQRMELDKTQEKLSPELRGDNYWVGVRPFYGQEVGSWKPWLISSTKKLLAPNPPKPGEKIWQNQLKQVETALLNITPNQTKEVVFWAGNPSTITPPGIWLKFADEFMSKEKIPLQKVLYVRSVLAMGIADSIIVVFYSKYSYWVQRPFMLNPNLHTIMPTPNHPSYPAGHSTISATAATILSYYFPQNKMNWWQKADEASSSRVWGGIHFPLDATEGLTLGKRVGNTVINIQKPLNPDKKNEYSL